MKIRTYETKNNIYCKIAKTTYEQDEERKERFRYMLMQRGIAIVFILAMIVLSKISKYVIGSEVNLLWVVALFIGVPVLLTNDRVIG